MNHVLILEDLLPAQTWLADAVLMALPDTQITCHDRLQKALHWLQVHQPNLCLVDLNLPDGSGIDCILACKAMPNPPAVLVITMFDDDQHLLPALKAGADGYLLKEEPKATIAHALIQLLNKQPALSAQITQRLMQIVQDTKAEPVFEQCPLTQREQDILVMVAKGYQTAELAQLLNISPHTAAKHLKNIYAKLGIHSRTEAVHEAMRFGLVGHDIPHTGDAPSFSAN